MISKPGIDYGAKKFKGLYVLDDYYFNIVYGPQEKNEISKYVDIYHPQISGHSVKKCLNILKDGEVVFSGWGGPVIDDEFLNSAPNLKAVFYAAGDIKPIAANGQLFDRGIKLTSSATANAIPVAEFCLSQILFSLKLGWRFAIDIKKNKAWMPNKERYIVPGCYNSTIGIISLGLIGQNVCRMLKQFSVKVLAYDPYVKAELAKELNVELCSLDTIFSDCDVISIHTPLLSKTKGFITGRHMAMMKPDSTIINTARGPLIREKEMIEVLKKRPDIMALLDVTDPEPPIPGSEIFNLENIITFPHIAGSQDNECRRMAQYAIGDFKRFRQGLPLQYEITKEQWLKQV